MPDSRPVTVLFDKPALYRILTSGTILESSKNRFPNMEIRNYSLSGNVPGSIIEGRVQDQAQLLGLIDYIHALHLSILEIKTIPNPVV